MLKQGRIMPTASKNFLSRMLITGLIVIAPLTGARADDHETGVRWGGRVTAVTGEQVTIRLLMASGSCGQAGPEHGTAQTEITVSGQAGQSYNVGQDIEVWIGNGGKSLQMPACLDW
jgi:hypothetical protein